MNGFIEKCLISALLCCLCVRANAQENIVKDIEEMGRFDHWTVRVIEESSIIGGATTYLYEPTAVNDTIYGRQAYVNPEGCVWRTSNAYADVLGVVKTSTSVFPEKRGDGYFIKGEYSVNDTPLIVSAGLTNKGIPRINNQPELVVIDINRY